MRMTQTAVTGGIPVQNIEDDLKYEDDLLYEDNLKKQGDSQTKPKFTKPNLPNHSKPTKANLIYKTFQMYK